jgi:hypothetical protein
MKTHYRTHLETLGNGANGSSSRQNFWHESWKGDFMKNRFFYLALVALLSFGGPSYAQEHAKVKKAHRLADSQLDWITAGDSGQDLGGTIVAAGSQATITNTGGVTLEVGAQSGAQALNLVNSTQSRVANGVNVWDGQLASQNGATKLNVNQNNQVFQQGFANYASLSDYQRQGPNVWTTNSSTSASKSASTDSLTNNSMVDTKQSISSSGSVDTGAGQTGPGGSTGLQIGQGIAGTGKLNIGVDAGSITVGLSSAVGVNGSVSSLFGSGTGSATSSFKAGAQFVLPKVNLSFDGGICYVEMGSCSAVGTDNKTASSETDSQASSSETWLAPVSIHNAKAQYIVADGSKLSAANAYMVFLNGTSEDNAKALNLVNAAGSLITDAVNVARTPTVGPVLNLNQTNVIVQQH